LYEYEHVLHLVQEANNIEVITAAAKNVNMFFIADKFFSKIILIFNNS
jgi:hypothetical protein